MTVSANRVYVPPQEWLNIEDWPIASLLPDKFDDILIASPEPHAGDGVTIPVALLSQVEFRVPGLDAISLALGQPGMVEFEITITRSPFKARISVPLLLRFDPSVLRPVKRNASGKWEPDADARTLDITLGRVDLSVDGDGNIELALPTGLTLPPCMIGSTGIVVSATDLRWLDSSSTAPHDSMPSAFNGLYLRTATLDLPGLEPPPGAAAIELEHIFIGTGGITGHADLHLAATWDGSQFVGPAAFPLFEFDGCLTQVTVEVRQSALTRCEIEGNIFVPYLDRVIGLSLGSDGNGALTAIAQNPTCLFADPADATTQGPSGYLLTADTDAFTLDISRVEFHAGGGGSASLTLSGRAKLKKIEAFDLPAVIFKGLRIDTDGHVAVEGGWLDVGTAKSSALSGFPFQITKIGFGAETDGRRWIGLNGGIKLADGLPIGTSVEGLRVIWNPTDGSVGFTLQGIGIKLSVPGTFSIAGKVAFFSNSESTPFRGSIKLTLDTLKLTVDASMMVGRTTDGTTYFFLFLDAELPAGAPLFSTGAAIYGFAGLLATNLRPSRSEGEDWYYGYYRRPPVGVTDSTKWSIQRDGFAIGLGTTVGSLPDMGFSFSAKALLVLVLPGPQLLLQGKGQFLSEKPDQKDPSSEGNFEALLVLDIPAKLFQANLAAAFKIPSLVEIAGGVNVAFTWAPNPPPDLWHVYLGEKTPEERRIHAKLFNLLQGDSWLMVNRPGTLSALPPDRKGEFEIGGSLGIDLEFDFSIAKAWLNASIAGEAAISQDPQQFIGSLALKGSAGVSALGLSCIADLRADALARAPTPWYLAVDIEVGIKIDLLLFKWEFHAKLPLEFGDKNSPLPKPVTEYTSISAHHHKADEAAPLDGALVPPDTRPLVLFSRPVQDLARFGAPGRDDLTPEDLGLRKVSYRLRHVVLLARDSLGPRLMGAAGEVEVSGSTVRFPGLGAAVRDRLPDISGSTISFFQPGEEPTKPPFIISAGSADSATVTGSPPQGKLSYRLTASRPSVSVQLSVVGDASSGEVVVTLASPLTNPSRFRGGSLLIGSASWLVLEATSTSVRIRVGNTLPSLGAATLLGPEPPTLEGQWAPTGDPVTGSDSSTRLQMWARTPFAFYRHNELNSVLGMDPFKPGYACGPEAVEKPICTKFEDVKPGQLTGAFSTAGVPATASGSVAAVSVGSGGPAQRLQLGDLATGRGQGVVTLTFNPPADGVWVIGDAREAGFVTARREGAVTAQVPLDRKPGRYEFTGGVDQIEVSGTLGAVYEVCFLPGWTCAHFETESFPQGRTGEVSYAGLTLASDGIMTVDGEILEVDPPIQTPPGAMIEDARDSGAYIATHESMWRRASTSAQPLRADMMAGSPVEERGEPITLPVLGLVEPVIVDMPALGAVKLVPGLSLPPPTPGLGGGFTPGMLPPAVTTVEPWRDPANLPRREIVDTARVWSNGKKVRLATVAIVFPRPVTRVRITLEGSADVVAFAGGREVCRGNGGPGFVVSLYADPAAASHIGWIDRVLVISPSQARVREVCIDAGDLGWDRYEQWKWSQGVQRSIESLYRTDPVLPPGQYEMRIHTVAVVTGEQPEERPETTTAAFIVGQPPGFPTPLPATGVDNRSPKYPYGGPLTQLATYVERTMPAAGAALWYRSYDTAVGFNEAYMTRMYLDAGHELRVSVVNASGVAIRSAMRHVWSGTDAELDSWSTQYIRTLIGDGGDSSCASVDLDKIVKPEQVTAGAGEPLEPARLHASELRSATAPSNVLHRFEFITSRYNNFRHQLATFDGRCRRLAADPAGIVSAVPPRVQAGVLRSLLTDDLAPAISSARTLKTKASSPKASAADLDAAKAAIAALAELRIDLKTQMTFSFDELWRACFALQHPKELPSAVRLYIVRAAATSQSSGTDVLLLESPEPIAWDRVGIAAASDTSSIPLTKVTTTFAPDFGRPDLGFEVEYGGIRWLAGVELWVMDGEIRARAAPAVPLDVTLTVDQAVSIELVLRIDPNGQAIISTDPPLPGGPMIKGPSSAPVTVALKAASGSFLKTARVQGNGVGILSCSVIRAFMPVPPLGPLCITESRLPTASAPLDHEIVVMAMDSVELKGYTIRWIDAQFPEASQLYVSLPHVTLREGQRLRLVPGRASSPVSDDALVSAGGAVKTPPSTGAIFQLVNPNGAIIHECAAMPAGQSVIPVNSLTAIPNDDGTRAFLVPPLTARGIERGYWVVFFQFAGDAGPDLDRWSVGGLPVNEKAKLTFTII